jgi:hypothetical protein
MSEHHRRINPGRTGVTTRWPIHIACQQAHTWKQVIADDGQPAFVRWCMTCDCVLGDDDCDPPQFAVADLIDGMSFDDDTVN